MGKVKGSQLFGVIMAWFVAAILGLTVAILAVALLGLWVAVGAFAGLGTTIVSGFFMQFLFVTDYDAVLAEKAAAAGDGEKAS